MKSIFNLFIIALFSFATVIAGTKGGTIEEKLALEAQRAEAVQQIKAEKVKPIVSNLFDIVKPYLPNTVIFGEPNSRAAYMLTVGGGTYDSEITWDISGTEYAGAAGAFDLELDDGDYTFNGYDSYGDGWNGATAMFTDAEGNLIASFAVEGASGSWTLTLGGDAPVSGCTDPDAPNYDPEATVDDGSCIDTTCDSCEFDWTPYGAECCDAAFEDIGANCATMEANYNWDCAGCSCPGDECTADADCAEGQTCDGYLCADPPEDCSNQTLDVGGGSWDGEITWSISDGSSGVAGHFCLDLADGTYSFTGCDSYGDGWNDATATVTNSDNVLLFTWDGPDAALAAGECESVDLVIGDAPESGCTDETACNYEADATLDDGSCTYPDCNGDCDGGAVVDDCGECGGDGTACAGCAYPTFFADGYCDASNNTAECNYDGGDCCGSTCVPGYYDCVGGGATWAACTADCLDPDANDDCCVDSSCDFFPETCEDNGLVTCWDGSCVASAEECPDEPTCEDLGGLLDCDGSGECAPSAYLGDGFCDGEDQAFGYDLTCYGCDGGDCGEANEAGDGCEPPLAWDVDITGLTAEGVEDDYDADGIIDSAVQWTWDALLDGTSCEENGQVTCYDGSCAASEEDCPEPSADCADCEFDWTAYGAECCDTAWGEYGIDCATLEGTYGWDCAGCNCPGDGPASCGDGVCSGDENHDNCPEDCSACAAGGGNDSWLADGYCDATNNNEICGFDNGDCCPTDCAEDTANNCPDNPTGCYSTCADGTCCGDCATCDDPNSVDNAEGGDCFGRDGSASDQSDDNFISKNKVILDGLSVYNPTIINIATGEIIPGTSNGNRTVSYSLNVSCDACLDGASYEGAFSAATSEMLIYGFDAGSEACGNVVGHSTEYGSTDPSADACANAGTASCILGDSNGDGSVDILDLVEIVNYILNMDTDPANHPCADYDEDGAITILDLVSMVYYILGSGGRDIDATSATMKIDDGSFSMAANGNIDGIQMTLSHGADFAIVLTDNALLADYKTTGNQTILIVLRPEGEKIFTANGDFEVVEVIVANSSGMVDVAMAPTEFSLSSAYPNPFNPTTSLTLAVPEAGSVSVQVYNIMGQVVATLASGHMDANTYTLSWDASSVSSGVYFVKAEVAGSVKTQKLMLMK